MSNTGKFKDRTPFLRVAGITSSVYGASADQSLRQDLYYQPRTATPEHTKKYRRSLREEPGVKQIHPGIYNDNKEYQSYIHGVKTAPSDHVTDCIFGTNLNGIKYFINEMQEQKYARCQREPLGKSIMRNYKFPEVVRDNRFKFGVETVGDHSAQELIYAPTAEESKETKRLYSKTHGLSDPGEQRDRNYNWYDIDKQSHVFGKFQPREYNGAKNSLITDFIEASYPKTKIVDKRLEDFRQATDEMIGKSKFKGTIRSDIDENFVFGVKSIRGDEMWNLGKCLHGDPYAQNPLLVEPDKDLGKSILHKSKLSAVQPKEYDPTKIFGVPSIRYDLTKKKNPSVNDITNYGNERDAFELLYPNPHVFRGVDDPDFEVLNSPDEIKNLLAKYNYEFKEEEFNLICQITLKNFPNEEGKISFKSFIDIMRNLKREYLKYRGILNS